MIEIYLFAGVIAFMAILHVFLDYPHETKEQNKAKNLETEEVAQKPATSSYARFQRKARKD